MSASTGNERHLEVPVNRLQLLADDQRRQLAGELPGEIRALGRRSCESLRATGSGTATALAPASAYVLFRVRAIAQVLERDLLEHVIGPVRVEQIARQDRVEIEPAERDAGSRQHERDRLEVVTTLANRIVLEQRLERPQNECRVELCRRGRAGQQVVSLPLAAMADRDVSPLPVGVDTAMPTMAERIAVG